ncbi:MAG TPA: hypothetical protein VN597_13635 [Streptosporangiaceae bacterium]|nr:hypothetical protein [Streptosporangiaceae bacterium]
MSAETALCPTLVDAAAAAMTTTLMTTALRIQSHAFDLGLATV